MARSHDNVQGSPVVVGVAHELGVEVSEDVFFRVRAESLRDIFYKNCPKYFNGPFPGRCVYRVALVLDNEQKAPDVSYVRGATQVSDAALRRCLQGLVNIFDPKGNALARYIERRFRR